MNRNQSPKPTQPNSREHLAPRPTTIDPGNLYRRIQETPGFAEMYAVDGPTAVGDAALNASSKISAEQGFRSQECYELNVIGTLYPFVQSMGKLEQIEHSRHSVRNGAVSDIDRRSLLSQLRKERAECLADTIAFNDSLKQMIDFNKKYSFKEVESVLVNMYGAMALGDERWQNNKDEYFEHLNKASRQIHETLIGVRSELTCEQIIGKIPEVEIQYALDDDEPGDATLEKKISSELQGNDCYLAIHDRIIGVDFKSSAIAAENKSNGIWSGVKAHEYNDKFTLTQDFIDEKVPFMRQQIEQLYIKQTSKHSTHERNSAA